MDTDNWYDISIDASVLKKEREKARKLKQSAWWKQILQRGLCHYCGEKRKKLTMDHIVPIARGGKSTKGNIVPSCLACNQTKKLETPVESILRSLREERSETEDAQYASDQ